MLGPSCSGELLIVLSGLGACSCAWIAVVFSVVILSQKLLSAFREKGDALSARIRQALSRFATFPVEALPVCAGSTRS